MSDINPVLADASHQRCVDSCFDPWKVSSAKFGVVLRPNSETLAVKLTAAAGRCVWPFQFSAEIIPCHRSLSSAMSHEEHNKKISSSEDSTPCRTHMFSQCRAPSTITRTCVTSLPMTGIRRSPCATPHGGLPVLLPLATCRLPLAPCPCSLLSTFCSLLFTLNCFTLCAVHFTLYPSRFTICRFTLYFSPF